MKPKSKPKTQKAKSKKRKRATSSGSLERLVRALPHGPETNPRQNVICGRCNGEWYLRDGEPCPTCETDEYLYGDYFD
jgi:hypothetical protein